MSERIDYDVIVAGASAAGLFAAHLLAKAGWRVAVFERRKTLGEPARTWIVTDELARVLGVDPSDTVVNRIDHMEVISPKAKTVVTLKSPDLIVERSLMLAKLETMVRDAGTEIFTGYSVTRAAFTASHVQTTIVRSSDNKVLPFRARHLIGADGTYSRIAQVVNAAPQMTVPVVQAHVKLPASYDPRWVKVWFDRHATRFFYWLIPESNGTAVLGLVADKTENARQLLDGFIKHHGYHALSYQGAVIPLHQPLRQLEWRKNESRILLVGDAAAHVKVTTVGGLVSGLWGAKAAAHSLIRNTSYSTELAGLNRELYLHDLIRWTLDRFSDDDYDSLLTGLNTTLHSLLSQRNRDSMADAVWALATCQPELTLLAAKRLLFPYRVEPSQTAMSFTPPLTSTETEAQS